MTRTLEVLLSGIIDAPRGVDVSAPAKQEGLVVLAVDAHELVCALLVEHAHLVVDVGAAHSGGENLVRDLAGEDGLRGVPKGREDDLAGVDERPVEVEQNRGKPHES